MSALPKFKFEPQTTFSTAYVSYQLTDLTEIYKDDVNLCVVNRTLDEEINHFVKALFAEKLHVSVVESLNVENFDFAKLLPQAKQLRGYTEFYKDIEHLVSVFCELFDLQTVGLRLGMLDKAMCPKFHVDHVPCRLVCTYGGIGTEWLEDRYINRAKLGAGSGGLTDDKSGLIQADLDVINTMPAYAIGLLKGSQWEGNEQNGAVHRSPKVTESAPYRLLLTLDFA
jgi:hypothetical protein